jgi:peptidyl-prolyl cis-trans isomerase C
MSRNRLWLAAAVALIVATVGAVVALTRTTVPEDAAFVYGDRVVSKAELNKRIDALRALYGISAPKSAKDRDKFRRSAAKSYAVTLIIDHEAGKRGIRISEKRARDLLDRLIESEFGTREAFIEGLGDVGTSERAVLDEIRRQGVMIELRTKIIGTVKISDAFLKSSFERRRATLGTPEQRRLANVVVPTRAEANRVLARLIAGESIETVAAEVSIDESTRTKGGDLGLLPAARLEDSVAEAAFNVKRGDVYGPARSSHGWNVGIVTDVVPGKQATFAEVKDSFRAQLQQEQELQIWTKWLAKVIKDANVHYADAYRPEDPDAPPPLTQATAAPIEGSQP